MAGSYARRAVSGTFRALSAAGDILRRHWERVPPATQQEEELTAAAPIQANGQPNRTPNCEHDFYSH